MSPATALAPLPFELVYDDGEPLETEWHSLELPLLRKLILVPTDDERADAAEAELARLRSLLDERG